MNDAMRWASALVSPKRRRRSCRLFLAAARLEFRAQLVDLAILLGHLAFEGIDAPSIDLTRNSAIVSISEDGSTWQPVGRVQSSARQ